MTRHHYDQTGTAKMRGEEQENEMEITYVIYLIDGMGEEFFITQEDELVRVNDPVNQKPLLVRTLSQLSAQLSRLRNKYPSNCCLFALERGEFDERYDQMKSPPDV